MAGGEAQLMEIKKTNRKQGIHSFFMNFSNYWPITGGHDLWGRRLGRWRSCYRGVAPRAVVPVARKEEEMARPNRVEQGLAFSSIFPTIPTVGKGVRATERRGRKRRFIGCRGGRILLGFDLSTGDLDGRRLPAGVFFIPYFFFLFLGYYILPSLK